VIGVEVGDDHGVHLGVIELLTQLAEHPFRSRGPGLLSRSDSRCKLPGVLPGR
jgi:hypothetical protein